MTEPAAQHALADQPDRGHAAIDRISQANAELRAALGTGDGSLPGRLDAPQKPEGVGTGAGDGAPRQDTASVWVNRSTDCPEAPAQAHPLVGRLSEALAAHWAAGMAPSGTGREWECTCGEALEMSEAAHLAHVADNLAAIIREHTDRALAEVESRIRDTFSDPERRRPQIGEFGTDLANDVEWCLLIVRPAQQEQSR